MAGAVEKRAAALAFQETTPMARIIWQPQHQQQVVAGVRRIMFKAAIRIKFAEQIAWAAVEEFVLRPAIRKARADAMARKSWWRTRAARGVRGKRAGCGCVGTHACRCKTMTGECVIGDGFIRCKMADGTRTWFESRQAAQSWARDRGLRFVEGK
jgi:hypothetical protein